MRRNPFEVLGISPEIVRELDDEALFGLVKACYRALQRAYHPDLQGSDKEKAVELNLAFEALDLERNPDSFEAHRKAYLKRLSRRTQKRTIDELNKRLAQLLRQQELLADNFWRHLMEASEKANATLFPEKPKMTKVLLLDIGLRFNASFTGFSRQVAFKEMLFDEEGKLYCRFPRRRNFQPVNFITLVGSVSRRRLEIWPLLERRPTKEAADAGLPDLKAFQIINALQVEVFKRTCLPLLKTELKENSYLFSLHRRYNVLEPLVFLEGMILKIEAASPKDLNKIVKKHGEPLHKCQSLPPGFLALDSGQE
ncbi:J domain-containing protein [Thermodesulfatator atlanticus]|uniref:J domain-containing protein n=1 Tax=Thermodesulfatator atlanticus TaxID=501497 RepID=UPI0003B47848|nr:J domain-containing protein [Thermodesulfatator atlanticus]